MQPLALWLRVFVFCMTVPVVLIVAGGVAAVVVVIVYLMTGVAELETVGEALSGDTIGVFEAAAALPMLATVLAWCILARKLFDRRSPWTMGLGRPRQGWTATVVGGTAAGGVPIAGTVGVLALADAFKSWSVKTSVSTWLLIPTLLLMAFMASAASE